MVETLKRTKQLQYREKELEGKLSNLAEKLKESENEKRILRSKAEKKEEEDKEKVREAERNFIRKLEEHKVTFKKMEMEMNGI